MTTEPTDALADELAAKNACYAFEQAGRDIVNRPQDILAAICAAQALCHSAVDDCTEGSRKVFVDPSAFDHLNALLGEDDVQDICRPTATSDDEAVRLLREAVVKLYDVQGSEAPKHYACNLLKRADGFLVSQEDA